MRAKETLPEGYREILTIDLQKDKRLMLWVNLIGLGIALLLAVPMHFVVPISTLFDMSRGFGAYILRFAVLIAASVAYIVLHELVHAAAMRFYGCTRVKFGFTGVYAFAGSDWYFDKTAYLVIALAPVVLWGAVLAVLNGLVPTSYFWVVYLLQVTNLSGAAGDLYVTCRFARLPRTILVGDSGVAMRVYAPPQE